MKTSWVQAPMLARTMPAWGSFSKTNKIEWENSVNNNVNNNVDDGMIWLSVRKNAWSQLWKWRCETLSRCLADLEPSRERAVTLNSAVKVHLLFFFFLLLFEMFCRCWCAATQLNAPWYVVSTERALWTMLEIQTSESRLANMTFSSSCWVVYTTQRSEGFNLMSYEPKPI